MPVPLISLHNVKMSPTWIHQAPFWHTDHPPHHEQCPQLCFALCNWHCHTPVKWYLLHKVFWNLLRKAETYNTATSSARRKSMGKKKKTETQSPHSKRIILKIKSKSKLGHLILPCYFKYYLKSPVSTQDQYTQTRRLWTFINKQCMCSRYSLQ